MPNLANATFLPGPKVALGKDPLYYLRLQKRSDPIMPKFVLYSAVRLSSKKMKKKKQRDYLWLVKKAKK